MHISGLQSVHCTVQSVPNIIAAKYSKALHFIKSSSSSKLTG